MYKHHAIQKYTGRGTKTLSHALDIITKPVFLKRGFAENRIITDWNNIVGDAIGARSVPRKLTFPQNKKSNGTLYVEAGGGSLATEMVYMEPVILEKIACYFGYKAVARLKILQNLKNDAMQEQIPATRKISQEKSIAMEEALAGIEDEELKESLRNLGHLVLAE